MFEFTHLSDTLVRCGLEQSTEDVDARVAVFIAYLAEFDARRLYATAGYDSIFEYCVEHLHRPDDVALRSIRAARTARRFPTIYPMLADGRLNVAVVVRLTPYLTRMNAEELLAAATHRSRSEIERLIAERFPSSEELALVERVAPSEWASPSESTVQLVPGPVAPSEVRTTSESTVQLASDLAAPIPSVLPSARRVTPIAPGRVSFHFSGPECMEEKYEHFRALRSHQAPDADMATTFEAALDIGIADLERRKFAAVKRPRRGAQTSDNPRYIPAAVKRAVRKRDGGRCTYVSDDGHRCGSRRRLEFDHIEPVARGGLATVENLRLRCRAHNQFEAERVFGREFIKLKRQRAAAG